MNLFQARWTGTLSLTIKEGILIMKNSTKKNLNNLINILNNKEILQELINQKAEEDDVKYILKEFKEILDSQFTKLL